MQFFFSFSALLALSLPVFAQQTHIQQQQHHQQQQNQFPQRQTQYFPARGPDGNVIPSGGIKRYENGVLVTGSSNGVAQAPGTSQVAVVFDRQQQHQQQQQAGQSPVAIAFDRQQQQSPAAVAFDRQQQQQTGDVAAPQAVAAPVRNGGRFDRASSQANRATASPSTPLETPSDIIDRPDSIYAYGQSRHHRSPGTRQTEDEATAAIRLDILQEGLDPNHIRVRITNQGLEPIWVLKYGIARGDGLVDDYFSNLGHYYGRIHRQWKETNIPVNSDNFHYLPVDQAWQYVVNLADHYEIPPLNPTTENGLITNLSKRQTPLETYDTRRSLLTAFLQYIEAANAPDVVLTPCQLRGLRVIREVLLRTGGIPEIEDVGTGEILQDTTNATTSHRYGAPGIRPEEEVRFDRQRSRPSGEVRFDQRTGEEYTENLDPYGIFGDSPAEQRPIGSDLPDAPGAELDFSDILVNSIVPTPPPVSPGTPDLAYEGSPEALFPGEITRDVRPPNNLRPLPGLRKRAEAGSECASAAGTTARTAFRTAGSLCNRAASFALAAPENVMNKYFGSGSNSIRQIVSDRFAAIAAAALDPDVVIYNCGDTLGYCGSGDTSYSINAQDELYFCPLFFNLPPSGGGCDDSTQAGVALHELSHFESVYAPATGDSAYGPACFSLDANTAVNNADTYELFAQALGSGCIG
ncbi:hypothetical protein BJ508DRAFT_378330 [Ascobolus immersus RN42]|uniref:Neutral protease 2 n=1 Tax=Ascobolus immersus RN42 TaxID=1160509 RepID=A0A3N4HX93_ASCIM|nr:hypothetical protein BJ508DRAFT_378330 [Ascobolus immersus RN42]